MKKTLCVDYDSLTITNKNLGGIQTDATKLNITGDWAPKLGGISDVLIEKQEAYYGNLLHFFKTSHLNIVNLETVIDTKNRDIEKAGSRLIDKPSVLSSLKSIDTHLVCMANNHIFDNGKEGLKETIKHLDESNIDHVGAGLAIEQIYKPFIYEKFGQKIAIINTAEGEESNEKYNNHCGASDIESYRVIDQIRISKKNGCFVILVAHAGVEFIPTPPPHIQDLYRTFVDEGADLVVAHHAHVTQGFEIYKGSPIFYSLGNFGIFRENSRNMEKIGYFLNIDLYKNNINTIKIIPYLISEKRLSLLSGEKLHEFKLNFKKSSEYILDKDILNRIWSEFISLRYIILEVNDLSRFFKYDNDLSKSIQFNFITQYSRRFMFLPQKVLTSYIYLDYLTEFGCIRRINSYGKIYLFTKNKFYYLNLLYKNIRSKLSVLKHGK